MTNQYETLLNSYNNYSIKCVLDWFIPSHDTPLTIASLKYKLTQYSPTIFAEVKILIPKSQINDFKIIEKLEVKNRSITLFFDDKLTNKVTNQIYNIEDFKLCVTDYTIEDCNLVNPYFSNLNVDTKYNKGEYLLISMICVDSVFYKMMLNEKFDSFGKSLISDIVAKIVKNNGGEVGIIETTNYAFKFLQSKSTDIDMIRGMLPYSTSRNGKDIYIFYLMNNKVYFAPIGYYTNSIPVLSIDKVTNLSIFSENNHSKFLSDKYSSLTNLYGNSIGFIDDSQINPQKINTTSNTNNLNYNMKQYIGNATTYVQYAIDDKQLRQNSINNLRHRILTYNKMISFTANEIIPNLTPLHKIELNCINNDNSREFELNGIYYIFGIEYIYLGMNRSSDFPKMKLILCSELDIDGIINPE